MSAPRAKGYSSSPKGIQSHILPHAGALTERATRYFGIDLARLPQMSDNELALFADRATAMTRLKEILPILGSFTQRYVKRHGVRPTFSPAFAVPESALAGNRGMATIRVKMSHLPWRGINHYQHC